MSKNLKNKYLYEAACVFDPFDFEYHCGSCNYFPLGKNHNEDSIKCPFYDEFIDGVLSEDSDWRDIPCNNFWD